MQDGCDRDLGEQEIIAHPFAQYKGRPVAIDGQLAHHQIKARTKHAAQVDQVFLQGGGNLRGRHLRRLRIDRGKILLYGIFKPLKHKTVLPFHLAEKQIKPNLRR